jgi:hypothetical protein
VSSRIYTISWPPFQEGASLRVQALEPDNLALPLSSCVTLSKLLSLSVPLFPHL